MGGRDALDPAVDRKVAPIHGERASSVLKATAEYIDGVLTRLTAAGAAYLVAVCLLPEFMRAELNVSFYFGGTSLLIVVVVVMDFIAQIQAHLMSHQYESLLKKANLKGGARTR